MKIAQPLPAWQQAIVDNCHHPAGTWELFPTDAYEESFPARFETIAARFPDRLAVVDTQRALTYADLNAAANRVAHGLVAQLGPGPGPIIHLFEQTVEGIIAIVAIAKAGKFYVPFDSRWPVEHLAKTLACIPPQAVLTDEQNIQLLQPSLENHTMAPIYTVNDFNTDRTQNPPLCSGPDDILYVTFTSGSTGTPKGVVNNHRTVLRSAAIHINSYHICPDDRALQVYRYSFNGGSYTIYGTLMTGSSLYLYDIHRDGIGDLAGWIHKHGLTVTSYTPSVFRLLADSVQDKQALATVRLLSLGGDRIRPADLQLYKSLLPDTACFRIAYGSTETAQCTQLIHDKESILEEDEISVGWPMADMDLLIVDEEGNPVPQGEEGEIVAHSRYTASGYWQEPALTAQKFRPDPDHPHFVYYSTGDNGRLGTDGRLYPLGRKDSQVKINGQRVELGAIEQAILTVAGIQNAVVALHRTEQGNEQLVAWFVWQPATSPWSIPQLRHYLAKQLPPYMIPVHFIVLDKLPLNLNGKVARGALPTPKRQRPPGVPAYVAPRSAVEAQLAAIWEEMLEIQPIGIHDDFFVLGGHSLLTAKLMVQIEEHFARSIPLLQFFGEPTIAQLAAKLEVDGAASEPLVDSHDAMHAGDADQQILGPPLAQVYDSVGVPGAIDGLMLPSGGRRWLLLHQALQKLPYPMRLRLARQLTRPPARGQLFRAEVQLIRRFLAQIKTTVDQAHVLDQSLYYGLLHKYQVQMPEQEQPSLYLASVEKMAQADTGATGILLLHSHNTLEFWGKRTEMVEATIGGVHLLTPHDDPNHATITDMLLTRQVSYAQEILCHGGIAQIAADGIHGKGAALTYDFHGRRRPFLTGFAELALATGAQVIPLLHSRTSAGEILQELGTPLDPGDESMPHTERVERLVSQYVALLSQMWRERPWMVPWYQMERHLAYPSIQKIVSN